MNRESRKLTAADRAELCRRVDLPAVLRADGVDVLPKGNAFLCKLRKERTPSCVVYPPGAGRKGDKGWTLHDYGDGWDGDALAYLVEKRGLRFPDAMADMCRLAGWTPESLRGCRFGDLRYRLDSLRHVVKPLASSSYSVRPEMTQKEQREAAVAFMRALLAVCPGAPAAGEAYLRGRGCLPAGWAGGAWVLGRADCRRLADALAAGPDADLLTRAGLLKAPEVGKPPRLVWWDAVCLLGCYDAAGRLSYFVGRRLDWRAGEGAGKYINQGTAGGAVRLPFNLPALYHAAGRLPAWPVKPDPDRAGELLLVEGPLDALGAAVLGWPAVALLTRLQAHDVRDRRGAAACALKSHLPALEHMPRVSVVPDADPGTKGAEGSALAASLVDWLCAGGVSAGLANLTDLCPDAGDCKDLADVAAKQEKRRRRS